MDLGCGDGRSIFFFNKQLKINFNGIEYDPYVYGNCKKLFNKYDNIKINHDDIMSFKFLEYNNDCFFIGDPLKKKYDFDKLIQKILEKNMKNIGVQVIDGSGGMINDIDDAYIEAAYKYANKIEKDSMRTVNYLLKEFEMKKSADSYQRASVAKTGVLDTNKLFSAKYNDDVFKRNLTIPEGKNHGLVMIIDWSGSMANNIFGCIKQVIELTLFCKKVNIPSFQVTIGDEIAWTPKGLKTKLFETIYTQLTPWQKVQVASFSEGLHSIVRVTRNRNGIRNG